MKSVRGKAPSASRVAPLLRGAASLAALLCSIPACSGDDARTLRIDAGAAGTGGTGQGSGGAEHFPPDASAPGEDASHAKPGPGNGGDLVYDASAMGGRTSGSGGSGMGGTTGSSGAAGLGGNGGSATGGTGGASGSAGGGAGGASGGKCGNGVVEAGEECDDGNTVDMDNCTSVCTDNKACLTCTAQGTACPRDPSGCANGGCDTQPYCDDYKDATAKQACNSVLSCVVRTQCLFAAPIAQAAQYCFCGTLDAETCKDKDSTHLNELTGPCAKEIIAAYRLNAGPNFTGPIDGAGIFNSITDVSIPSGGAMSLAACIADSPCGNKLEQNGKCQCVTDHTKRVNQCGRSPVGAGGSGSGGSGNGGSGNGGSAGTSSGGSAGTSSGGSAGASSGGSAGTSSGGAAADPYCGAPFAAGVPTGFQGVPAAATTPTACSACESNPAHCPRDPSGCAFGSCDTQPLCSDYKSDADKASCLAVERCVRQTNCISAGATACYCGNTDLNTCTGSVAGATGVCKDVIVAGFPQQTTSAAILMGLFDVIRPAGGAMSLAECDRDNCVDECIPYCK